MKKILKPFIGNFPVTQVYGAIGQTNYYTIHIGIDYGCPSGTKIVSCDNGKVVYAGWATGYGNMVKIQHEWGFSIYGHLKSFSCNVGHSVNCREVIALSNNTGNSTGSHLHFETRDLADRAFNQTQYITTNINEVIDMALTQQQVDRCYWAILKRAPEANCPYVGSLMSEVDMWAEVADSKENCNVYDDAMKYRAGQTGDIVYEKITEELYRKK